MGCDRDSETFYETIVSARTTDQPNGAAAAVLPVVTLVVVHVDEKLMAKWHSVKSALEYKMCV